MGLCGTGAGRAHATPVTDWRLRPNQRLKLTARVDYGMNLSSARRSLSAIRYAAHDVKQSLLVVR
jgi:hypothetical protein